MEWFAIFLDKRLTNKRKGMKMFKEAVKTLSTIHDGAELTGWHMDTNNVLTRAFKRIEEPSSGNLGEWVLELLRDRPEGFKTYVEVDGKEMIRVV